jgi:hypothetical protein
VYPIVASDGDRFLVVWNEDDSPNPAIRARFVEANRSLGGIFTVYTGERLACGRPAVAFDAVSQTYLVTFALDSKRVLGREYDHAGNPLGDTFLMKKSYAPPSIERAPRVAAGLGHYMVTWGTGVTESYPQNLIRYRRVRNGAAAGLEEYVYLQSYHEYESDIASLGAPFLVVWRDQDPQSLGINVDTLAFSQHFYTSDPTATAFNASRHIALDPTTGWLHIVYAYGSTVLYSYSSDQGQTWEPVEVVGDGVFPCVVCEGQGMNPVWTTYQHSFNGVGSITTKARLGPGQWATFDVCPQGASLSSGPAMSICNAGSGQMDEPSVYVAYSTVDGQEQYRRCFNRVGLITGVTEGAVLAGPSEPNLLYPTIATTPGDIVHVAWMRYWQDESSQRIFYRQRVSGLWQAEEPVSDDPQWPWAEPASYPSAEAYGDSVYVVWRGMSDLGDKSDIWQRKRIVDQGQFFDTKNRSLSGTTASFCPQQSGHWTSVWPEETDQDWSIWVNVFDEIRRVFQDPLTSQWPSITTEWYSGSQGIEYLVHTAWTHATQPLTGRPAAYEVLYLRCSTTPHDAPNDCAYYDCAVGDSTQSRYCLSRDGHARWRDFSVDLGRASLRYRLPFLSPSYDYKLKAVLFQTSKDTWEQSFAFDSANVARVRFRPLVPETVLMTIPRALYARDCKVILDIGKLAGEYAVVAELKLYQCYPYRHGEGEELGGTQAQPVPAEVTLLESGPTLFADFASISYTVKRQQPVTVAVYDKQGRLVRRLATGEHDPGAYSVQWNRTDACGAKMPAGTYFCRVGAGGAVRKLVLTR